MWLRNSSLAKMAIGIFASASVVTKCVYVCMRLEYLISSYVLIRIPMVDMSKPMRFLCKIKSSSEGLGSRIMWKQKLTWLLQVYIEL
jgi:hypothetical protein